MSQAHHADPIEENIETHPAMLALWVALGAIALVVGIVLLVQFAVDSYGGRSLATSSAMSPEALAKRIGPVASFQVEGDAPVAPGTVPSKAAAGPAKAAVKADGKTVYDTTCMACHAAGVAGAPKLGDKAAWAPRMKGGSAALYASALKGKNAMPAKGGNASLADEAIKAAVDYMVAASK
jgi:cytochrome c5